MNLEKQCVSLDIAKRIKELGVKQDSIYSWANAKLRGIQLTSTAMVNLQKKRIKKCQIYDEDYSSYTAAELLDLLPYHITTKEPEPFNSYRLYISGSVIVKNPECIDPVRIHLINYNSDTYQAPHFLAKQLTSNFWDENPANAFAKMLIFLYEQGLITHE